MSWKPDRYDALSPYLLLEDPEAAAAFCVEVFGAKKRLSEPGGAGGKHVELRIDDTILMLGGPAGSTAAMLHHFGADPDAVMAGATRVQAMADQPDGDRRGGFRVPVCMQWFVARRR